MMGYGMGGIGILGMLFFWTAIVGATLWLLAQVFPGARAGQYEAGRLMRGGPAEPPLEILKSRYAAGELSREEYEAMRGDLEGWQRT